MAVASALVPTWRSLDQAAEQSGVSRRTLNRWISDGRLRVYSRAGDRKRYVDLDDIRNLQQLQPVEMADALRDRLVALHGPTPPEDMTRELRERMLSAGLLWDGRTWVQNRPEITTRVPPPSRPRRR